MKFYTWTSSDDKKRLHNRLKEKKQPLVEKSAK